MEDILIETEFLRIEREVYSTSGKTISFSHSGEENYTIISGEILSCYSNEIKLWTGVFQRGSGGTTGVFSLHDTVVVLLDGAGYWVPVKSPENFEVVPLVPIRKALSSKYEQIIIFEDYTRISAYDPSGLKWVTEDLSWDGLKNVKIESDCVIGQGWSAPLNEWISFSINMETGVVVGGAYNMKIGK